MENEKYDNTFAPFVEHLLRREMQKEEGKFRRPKKTRNSDDRKIRNVKHAEGATLGQGE